MRSFKSFFFNGIKKCKLRKYFLSTWGLFFIFFEKGVFGNLLMSGSTSQEERKFYAVPFCKKLCTYVLSITKHSQAGCIAMAFA